MPDGGVASAAGQTYVQNRPFNSTVQTVFAALTAVRSAGAAAARLHKARQTGVSLGMIMSRRRLQFLCLNALFAGGLPTYAGAYRPGPRSRQFRSIFIQQLQHMPALWCQTVPRHTRISRAPNRVDRYLMRARCVCSAKIPPRRHGP